VDPNAVVSSSPALGTSRTVPFVIDGTDNSSRIKNAQMEKDNKELRAKLLALEEQQKKENAQKKEREKKIAEVQQLKNQIEKDNILLKKQLQAKDLLLQKQNAAVPVAVPIPPQNKLPRQQQQEITLLLKRKVLHIVGLLLMII
jgi:hypothetical protein